MIEGPRLRLAGVTQWDAVRITLTAGSAVAELYEAERPPAPGDLIAADIDGQPVLTDAEVVSVVEIARGRVAHAEHSRSRWLRGSDAAPRGPGAWLRTPVARIADELFAGDVTPASSLASLLMPRHSAPRRTSRWLLRSLADAAAEVAGEPCGWLLRPNTVELLRVREMGAMRVEPDPRRLIGLGPTTAVLATTAVAPGDTLVLPGVEHVVRAVTHDSWAGHHRTEVEW